MNAATRAAGGGGSRTLVCFALPDEAAPFQKLMRHRPEVAILSTGMGRENARRAVREFCVRENPRHIFTCGFAGGLNPALNSGTVIFAADDAALASRLAAAGAHAARFVCVERIAVTAVEKNRLWQETGADAVEMESEAIHAFCRDHSLRCATVRVISDAASEDLPLDFNALTNADQSLNPGKLAWAVVRAPGKIPALLKLRTTTRHAAQALAAVLSQVV